MYALTVNGAKTATTTAAPTSDVLSRTQELMKAHLYVIDISMTYRSYIRWGCHAIRGRSQKSGVCTTPAPSAAALGGDVQAVADAHGYLATVGASGTVTVSGDAVTVTITASQNTQLLGMVGISSLTVHGTGSAHPQRGVVDVDP